MDKYHYDKDKFPPHYKLVKEFNGKITNIMQGFGIISTIVIISLSDYTKIDASFWVNASFVVILAALMGYTISKIGLPLLILAFPIAIYSLSKQYDAGFVETYRAIMR